MRRALLAFAVALGGLVVPAQAAFATNALDATYTGATTPSGPTSTGVVPAEHSDADVTFVNGKYVMFYRKAYNGHLAIWRTESTYPDSHWSGDTPVIVGGQNGALGCDGAYAPSVTVRSDGVLFMVYEADPKVGVYPNSTNCETNTANTWQYVAYAKSTDNGLTWTNFQKLFWYSTAANGANLGTPEMQILPGSKVEVSWHVNPGAAGPGNPFFRQMAMFPTGDPGAINSNNYSSITRLNYRWQNGTDITATNGYYNMDGGPGRADIIQGPDGYYYTIVEAFGGQQPICGGSGFHEGLFIGRSTSVQGPYVLSNYLMGTQINTICTQDMPAWYTWNNPYLGLQYRFILTNRSVSPNRIDYRELVAN